MRIEQLEYLAAVTRHGSLRRAGEHLHLSQPALSESLSKLERELGVRLLDRRRTGARISRQGRDLQQYMDDVLEAVDRLRSAAGDQRTSSRLVRVGTVHAATATLLAPAIARLQAEHPDTGVEVVTLQQPEIEQGLLEGGLDLGLVNLLAGDDTTVGLGGADLLHGRPVAVLPAGHPLTAQDAVSAEDLRGERFVAMRAGYLMHRFAHRFFDGDLPRTSHATDGAEIGKLMVAEGLGVTLLPDYSVLGDPLHRAGALVVRPLRGDRTAVTLALRQRTAVAVPVPVRRLREALVDLARNRTEDPVVRGA